MSRNAAPTSDSSIASGPGRLSSHARLSLLGVLVTRSEVALAAVFLWAAWNKLVGANAPQVFASSVEAFKLGLPEMLVRLTTSAVPWVEAIAGMLLLFGFWSRSAALVLNLLLVAFIVLIAQAIGRGLDMECGCFGKLSPFCPPKVGMCNVIQNAVLLALGLLIMLTPRHKLVVADPICG